MSNSSDEHRMSTFEFWNLYKKFDKNLYVDAERTTKEVNFISGILNRYHLSSVLDLGCGSGRIALKLAQLGFRVIGIDADTEEIETATTNAEQFNLTGKLDYECQDFRKVELNQTFDAAIFIYSSFGYFDDKTNLKILKKTVSFLNPKGIVILDLLNPSWAIHKSKGKKDITEKVNLNEFTSIIRERRPAYNNKYEKTIFSIVTASGDKFSVNFKQRLYMQAEVSKILTKAGMKLEHTFGGYGYEEYSENSKRLIVIARKF